MERGHCFFWVRAFLETSFYLKFGESKYYFEGNLSNSISTTVTPL
jgi:hypothetical protein